MQELATPKLTVERQTLDWLLEDEPSVQYFTLTQLLGKSPNDRSVKESLGRIGREGWAATLQLEEAGKPSKWITLQALLTLKRFGMLEPTIA